MGARQDADNWPGTRLRVAKSKRTCGKPATLITPLIIGGFNVIYSFKVEGLSSQILVRLPCPDQAMLPEEKIMVAVAIAACMNQQTQLPVPKAFHHGVDEIGPYMIIEDLGTRRGMSHALEAPSDDTNDTPILNPKISETELESLYLKMAECVFQLARPTFPRIGALIESDANFSFLKLDYLTHKGIREMMRPKNYTPQFHVDTCHRNVHGRQAQARKGISGFCSRYHIHLSIQKVLEMVNRFEGVGWER
ncbi:phosphotransferase [Fusarium pseudocircinatum]|uniref:Phosphotransferase n=1 Tax=Fusarium pseudocircinatum TaxID=56676 RepID=A0A8H5PRN6_9HYPO|nr:phosphotransferase [Fusarium pseudocircinatum]